MDGLRRWKSPFCAHDKREDRAISAKARKLIRQCPCRQHHLRCSMCIIARTLLEVIPSKRTHIAALGDHESSLRTKPSRRSRTSPVPAKRPAKRSSRHWEDEHQCFDPSTLGQDIFGGEPDDPTAGLVVSIHLTPGTPVDAASPIPPEPGELSTAMNRTFSTLGRLLCPNFSTSQQQALTGPAACQAIFGSTYGRGTTNMLGIWSGGPPQAWSQVKHWVQQQTEIWFGWAR
ncbi:hypothetical protein B0J18DRAFT_202646 [Chaetomium sp. MPI-SDFR-AT-0129]|nr:hypothetical protein B0J18DRAFT_202646 [Chaetomium sp. MPI-SDFR-AT-0129]